MHDTTTVTIEIPPPRRPRKRSHWVQIWRGPCGCRLAPITGRACPVHTQAVTL